MSEINLYDIVELKEDVPDLQLKVGMTGTVIDSLAGDAWLVEFDDVEDADGFPAAYGFYPKQIAVVTRFADMKSPYGAGNDVFPSKRPSLKVDMK